MKVIVVAKEPVAGRVKTRLHPPCTLEEAASLAEAALADTLDAAMACGCDEVVVALDGRPGPWCPPGARTVPQVDGPFGERLAAAWDTIGGPAIQIGMDTPQVTSALLDGAMTTLAGDTDAVLGPAADGGWWLLGLRRADRRVFDGVPMSSPHTGTRQLERLAELDLRVAPAPELVDVDTIGDAFAVAALAPRTRFARAMASVGSVGGRA